MSSRPRAAEVRKAVLVLGMHRTGTSAITRTLNLLGARLPEHLMPAEPGSNDTGFWESVEVVRLHDELLASLGQSWATFRRISPAFWEEAGQRFAPRMAAVLEGSLPCAPLVVIKDPRMCRLVPLWLEVTAELEVEPRFLLWLRHPLEVADSLEKRDGFHRSKSMLFWLRHVLDAERDTRPFRRALASYEELISDWRTVVDRISRELGLGLTTALEEAGREVDGFISASHRHHAYSHEDLSRNDTVGVWVKETYNAALGALAGDWSGVSETFDRVRTELDAAEEGLAWLVGDLERFQTAVYDRDRAIEELSAEVTRLQVETAACQARANELEEVERQLEKILRSRSWRLTEPLRRLRTLIRRS